MKRWRKTLAAAGNRAEARADRLKLRLRKRLGRLHETIILPYHGFGTPERLTLKGRVLADRGITRGQEQDTVWRNLLNMYRRFASDEVRGARVRATFGNATHETVSDQEGYFSFDFAPDPSAFDVDRRWQDVALELVDVERPVRARGRVLVPPAEAEFGVISDLDDTILKSDVVNLLKLARNTLLKNARTRLPFEGVAAFYQALQAGTRSGHNPIFYVSSSPWNLYDLLVDFFEIRGIPAGPLLLAELGVSESQVTKARRRRHKLAQIHRVLEMYAALPFILIGDSGETDPEIYLQVVLDHPGRIAAIYIRDVGREKRGPAIARIAAQVTASGGELLLVKDTVEAATHAVGRGFIQASALPRIRQERAGDVKPANPLERLLDDESLA